MLINKLFIKKRNLFIMFIAQNLFFYLFLGNKQNTIKDHDKSSYNR